MIKYLRGICREMDFVQLVIFCVFKRSHLLYVVGHGWLSFLVVWVAIVLALIVFIVVWKRLYAVIINVFSKLCQGEVGQA